MPFVKCITKITDGGFMKMGITQHSIFKRLISNAISFLLIVCTLLLTACSFYDEEGEAYDKNDRIMNETVKALVQAIEDQNKAELVKLFSLSAIEDLSELSRDVDELFLFIRGCDISFDSSIALATSTQYDHGKVKAVAYNMYCLETEESKYYLAIRICTEDTDNESDVGILSMYVIDADDWKESYRYLGGGKWVPGIHIDKKVNHNLKITCLHKAL